MLLVALYSAADEISAVPYLRPLYLYLNATKGLRVDVVNIAKTKLV